MLRFLLLILSFHLVAEEIPLDYQRMDRGMFETTVVGNTVIGITRQSHSVYLLYFLPEGDCELWKQNQIYTGKWWIEIDALGRDVIRALWPTILHQKQGRFFLQNPGYGTATSLRYYIHRETGALLLSSKKTFRPALLAPGCVFP